MKNLISKFLFLTLLSSFCVFSSCGGDDEEEVAPLSCEEITQQYIDAVVTLTTNASAENCQAAKDLINQFNKNGCQGTQDDLDTSVIDFVGCD